MNKNEISEIKNQLSTDKSNITSICGCYVNDKKTIISTFTQSVVTMPQEVIEKYLVLFKKTLSGTIAKNLIDIVFSTEQVVSSDEHKLLSTLRNTELKDDSIVQDFFNRVIQQLAFEGNYLILLAHNTYDVPYKSSDGIKLEDGSSNMFSYIMCSICPVKLTKPALSYSTPDNKFHSRKSDWVVAPPQLGFMFPAFDDRSSNIYNALYYTKDTHQNYKEFIDAIFNTETPMPAAIQKQTFEAVLSDALADSSSYEVIQTVHEQLSERIEAHKINKEIVPLVISKHEVKDFLQACNVAENSVTAFEEKFDAQFGPDAYISPNNIIDPNRFEVKTPNVIIKVKPEHSNLISTGTFCSNKYVFVFAEDGVEVNGVTINISDDAEDEET